MKIDDVLLVKGFNATAYPASSKKISPKLGQNLAGKDLLVGQFIKGRVTGFAADGKVLLEIAGKTLTAKAEIELSRGQSVWLEVKEVGSTLVLSPADRKVDARNLLRFLFSNRSVLTDTLAHLTAVPDNQADGANGASSLAIITRLLASVGNQDADVAKIMALASLFKSNPVANSAHIAALLKEEISNFIGENPQQAGIKSGIDKLMHWLSGLHSLNGQPTAAEQLPFFIFPCLLAAGQGWGEWMINFEDADSAGQGAEGQYSLDFFLELSRLGDMHLRLTVNEGSVFGVIAVHNEEAEAHLKVMLPQLRDVLGGLGFAKVDVVARLADKNSLQALKVLLADKAQLANCNMVDLTA